MSQTKTSQLITSAGVVHAYDENGNEAAVLNGTVKCTNKGWTQDGKTHYHNVVCKGDWQYLRTSWNRNSFCQYFEVAPKVTSQHALSRSRRSCQVHILSSLHTHQCRRVIITNATMAICLSLETRVSGCSVYRVVVPTVTSFLDTLFSRLFWLGVQFVFGT